MTRVSMMRLFACSVAVVAVSFFNAPAEAREGGAYAGLVNSHAAAHGLPPSLVHRVIMRESRYNPRAVSKGNYGMMQIRLGTARAMGYRGDANGLLDANTNMTYAVKYLAGAYRAAGGNHDRAVALYARGYHDVAKRQGTSAVALANRQAVPLPLPALSPEARRARGDVSGARRAVRRGMPQGVTTSREHEVR